MANANALKDRLSGVYDEQPAQQVTPPLKAGKALPGGTFGTSITDVKTIVIHETDGFPSRNRAGEFVGRYIDPTHEKRGFGPQFFVSSDGTIARLVGDGLITWHATFLNLQSLGIENGHLDNRNSIVKNGIVLESWHQLSPDGDTTVPGQTLYALRHRFDDPVEVLFCWYPTAAFAGPKGSSGAEAGMLFTEGEYRSLAALARYLAEKSLVLRNFPLLPWATREGEQDNPKAILLSPRFRAIVLADERFGPIVNKLAALGFSESTFVPGSLKDFRDRYHAAVAAQNTLPGDAAFQLKVNTNKQLNRAWMNLFHEYRGFHGHGFAGSITHHDDHTTCPGALFDWHRFAREVWDWWWYPFDFDSTFTATSTPRRPYSGAPGIDTPLVEYYFENTPADGRPDPYAVRTNPPFAPLGGAGIFGVISSPSTFVLGTGAPIYAMANGELVAARLMPAGAGVSMSFALVRHDVYHDPDSTNAAAIHAGLGLMYEPPGWAGMGRINYDTAPTTVYSLYMHLGGIDQMNFDRVAAGNPDWLNRVIIRKKECDFSIDATGQLHPALRAMPAADFTRPAPAAAGRPTSIELLRMDQERLGFFLDDLRRGNVAPAPIRHSVSDRFGPTPITVALGDFLGLSGVIRVSGGASTQGISVEVFSRDPIDAFRAGPNVARPAEQYVSLWALDPTDAQRSALQAIGVNPDLVRWWKTAADYQLWDSNRPASATLPVDGQVYHYFPLDFLKWINDVTWASEWPKYRMKNPDGTDMQRPAKPRSRRIS